MPISPAQSQSQAPQFSDSHTERQILHEGGSIDAPPSYSEDLGTEEITLRTAPVITPDQLRANHPGVMSKIPPFMLKGAALGLIAVAIPLFGEAGWAPKATATAVIALVIRIFPRLQELSEEGREAQVHAEEQILTREAYLEILEQEFPELKNRGQGSSQS